MNKKIKIRISDDAYYRILDILKDSDIYSHIRLQYKDGCCGSSKVELLLDNAENNDIVEFIDELPFIYNSELINNIKEVTIVYREGSFMMKSLPVNTIIKDCATCKLGCGGKESNKEGCTNCKKDGCK